MSISKRKRKRFTKWRVDLAIHQALETARRRSIGPVFQELLSAALCHSELLRPRPGCGRAGWAAAERHLQGLLALADHRRSWLHEPAAWPGPVADEGSLREQFGSLARHLLASHAVPQFMTGVWFERPSQIARRHQKLYKHLARGNSVRGASLPIALSKQAARAFPTAPHHFSVEQAVRWSQVRGMGGSQEFASAVGSTPLGEKFENPIFWSELLRLLIRQPKLDVQLVPSIVEFLLNRQIAAGTRVYHLLPERRFQSFLTQVRKWNSRYQRRVPHLSWPHCGLAGMRMEAPRDKPWSVRSWMIRELTTSRELIDDGLAMRHCVARYAWSCKRRATTIWSLSRHGSLGSQRVLTIQLDPEDWTIITALGRCNSRPTPEAREVMERWARREGLAIARWV